MFVKGVAMNKDEMKFLKFLLLPLITVTSYIFNDDPNPDPEFMKLSFMGRMKFYYQQIDEEE